MFDAHCHLDRVPEDPQAVLQRARQAGITDLVVAGVQASSWDAQTRLSQTGVHVAWGVHPWRVAEAPNGIDKELDALSTLLKSPPIPPVALGETGLDHGQRLDPKSQPQQAHAFRAQIRLAHVHQLPLILHIVRAHEAAAKILEAEGVPEAGGMVHSFSGSAEQAQHFVSMGLHISFCGSVVNPKNRRVRRAASSVPTNRLLVETDAPDQTPIHRKPLPNEPAFLIDVISAIAEIRGTTPSQVSKATATNAHALFRTQNP